MQVAPATAANVSRPPHFAWDLKINFQLIYDIGHRFSKEGKQPTLPGQKG
jgi:hypothetical protein